MVEVRADVRPLAEPSDAHGEMAELIPETEPPEVTEVMWLAPVKGLFMTLRSDIRWNI